MAERKMTRQEAKKVEAEKYTAYVKSVLAEAHAAAGEAAAKYIKSANRTPDGHVADLCGGGTVVVYKPSYRLRETLKALEEVRHDYDGAWRWTIRGHKDRQTFRNVHPNRCPPTAR